MKTINFEKYNINNDKILERTGELFLDRLPEAWDRELTTEDLETIDEQLEQWLEANAPTENDRYTNRTIDGQIWDYYGAY